LHKTNHLKFQSTRSNLAIWHNKLTHNIHPAHGNKLVIIKPLLNTIAITINHIKHIPNMLCFLIEGNKQTASTSYCLKLRIFQSTKHYDLFAICLDDTLSQSIPYFHSCYEPTSNSGFAPIMTNITHCCSKTHWKQPVFQYYRWSYF
jgi:hypothetical protein